MSNLSQDTSAQSCFLWYGAIVVGIHIQDHEHETLRSILGTNLQGHFVIYPLLSLSLSHTPFLFAWQSPINIHVVVGSNDKNLVLPHFQYFSCFIGQEWMNHVLTTNI